MKDSAARLPVRKISRWMCLLWTLAMVVAPQPAAAQTVPWVRQFGSTVTDSGNAVAVDSTGVYVVGDAGPSLPGQTGLGVADAFVRKYDRNGAEVWTRQFGTSANDHALGVAVNASGVYVVGDTAGILPGQINTGVGAGRTDAFIRKYDTNGNEQWTRQFGTTAYDYANGVAVDSTGVYVVGTVARDSAGLALPGQTAAGASDAFVRKYDFNGTELWTSQFGSARDDRGNAVAVNASGVYVVGDTGGQLPGQTALGGSFDAYLRKYDANGNEQWTRQFGTTAIEGAAGVAVDDTGVYVTGDTGNVSFPGGDSQTGTGIDYLEKFDLNGTRLWVRQFGTGSSHALAAVAYGTRVYVAGSGGLTGQTSAGGFDAYVRRFDPSGAIDWTTQFGTRFNDAANGAAVDSTGVYLAGSVAANLALTGQTTVGGEDAFATGVIPAPIVYDGGIVNNASFVPSPAPMAPGTYAAVFGLYLNDGSTTLFSSFGPDNKLITTLAGTSVKVNNISAPIFYSTPTQLGIQIPFEVAGQSSATIQATVAGQTSLLRSFPLEAVAPGIFTANQQGTGIAAVLHQDGVTAVTSDNPARPNEIVIFYATGLGAVTPELATGAAFAGNRTVGTATVTIDGVAAEVQFSGGSFGFVSLYQINLRIPGSTPANPALPVLLAIGGRQSNPVTIPVAP